MKNLLLKLFLRKPVIAQVGDVILTNGRAYIIRPDRLVALRITRPNINIKETGE